MLWLDHLIFGNGRGICSPYFDNTFYWLVDTSGGRGAGRGRLYTYFGGFGAQMRSMEWRAPKAGTCRQLAGVTFTVFSVTRRGPRVDVAWAMRLPDDIDLANAKLRDFRERLSGHLFGSWPPEGHDTLDATVPWRQSADRLSTTPQEADHGRE